MSVLVGAAVLSAFGQVGFSQYQAADTQVDAHWPAAERNIGEVMYVAAVDPAARDAAARTPRGHAVTGTGTARTITTGPAASTEATTTAVKCGSSSNSSTAHNERIPADRYPVGPISMVISGYENLARAVKVRSCVQMNVIERQGR